jgi:hypothetical protein
MFTALIARPQEALHKRRIMRETAEKLQPFHSQLTLYARNIPNSVCAAPPENEQVMLETC